MTADLKNVRTIQQTGKGPKLIQLGGRIGLWGGLLVLAYALALEARTADHLIAPAVIGMFAGVVAIAAARVLVWWRHD